MVTMPTPRRPPPPLTPPTPGCPYATCSSPGAGMSGLQSAKKLGRKRPTTSFEMLVVRAVRATAETHSSQKWSAAATADVGSAAYAQEPSQHSPAAALSAMAASPATTTHQ